MLRKQLKQWVLLLAVILLTGCAISPTKLTSKIDSRAVAQIQNYKTYWLLPGQDDILESDLAYREYCHYVDTSLQQLGYVKAQSRANANVVIFFSYGAGQPHNHFYNENRSIIARPSLLNLDNIDDFADTVYISEIKAEIVYNRYIKLDAYKAKPYNQNKRLEPLWSIKGVSVGQSDDLRVLFPYILVSMMPYIATDSQHQLTVSIKDNDPQVSQLIIQSKKK